MNPSRSRAAAVPSAASVRAVAWSIRRGAWIDRLQRSEHAARRLRGNELQVRIRVVAPNHRDLHPAAARHIGKVVVALGPEPVR